LSLGVSWKGVPCEGNADVPIGELHPEKLAQTKDDEIEENTLLKLQNNND